MSDKEIVEQSSLLQHLLPGKKCIDIRNTYAGFRDCKHSIFCVGDIILADRGFTCDEHARMAMAEIKTPLY